MKATGNVTPMFGNGSGGSFSAAPALADLKPRFKAEFGTPLSALLAAAGFTRVTGPTPIDWDAITYDPTVGVGSSPVSVGRDHYRFDDADQAGHPVFLVIDHRIARVGSTAGATAYMMFPDFYICHGINGSGAPTSIARKTSTYPSRGSGDAAYLPGADLPVQLAACTQPGFMSLRGHPTSSSPLVDPNIPMAFHVLVERLRDATGAPQSVDRGIVFITSAYDGSNSLQQYVGVSSLDTTSLAAQTVSTSNPPVATPPTYVSGTVAPIYPVAFLAPRPRSSRNWCAGSFSDWPLGSEATIPVPGGGTGNFKSLGRLGTGFSPAVSSTVLVRWE